MKSQPSEKANISDADYKLFVCLCFKKFSRKFSVRGAAAVINANNKILLKLPKSFIKNSSPGASAQCMNGHGTTENKL